MDNNSPTIQSTLSLQPSRTRRSMCSLNSHSQKSFSIKTTETILTTRGVHPSSSSDKCGLIANDGNNLDGMDDRDDDADDEQVNMSDSMEDNDLEMISSQSNRGLRKTVLNNVDRFLTSANKQIKL